MIVENFSTTGNSDLKLLPLTLVTVWDFQTREIIKELTFDGVLLGSPFSLILGSSFTTHLGQNRTWNNYLDMNGELWRYDLDTQKSELLTPNSPPANNQLVLSDLGKPIWFHLSCGAEIIPAGNCYLLSPGGGWLAIFKESGILLWEVENQKAIANISFNETFIRAMFQKTINRLFSFQKTTSGY
nr:hypothetical protein [Candidatus Moduliflexus flocculans]